MVATDVDERAVACAKANGVEAYRGDLFAPLPPGLDGRWTWSRPGAYVRTPDLALLQRDTFAFESALSYDGGQDGTDVLRRVIAGCPRYLRRGGALLLSRAEARPTCWRSLWPNSGSSPWRCCQTWTAMSAASRQPQ